MTEEGKWYKNEYDWIEYLPCAAYLLKDDIDFTLIFGNSFFYQLIGYSEEVMQYRFGNRFSALLDAKAQGKILCEMHQGEQDVCTFSFKIRTDNKKETFLNTMILSRDFSFGKGYLCVSVDISKEVKIENKWKDYQKAVLQVIQRTDFEAMEYHLETEQARIYTAHFLLNQLNEEELSRRKFIDVVMQANLVLEEYKGLFVEFFKTFHQTKKTAVCEMKLYDQEGLERWITLSLEMKKDQNQFAILLLKDVTQQKEASLWYLLESQYYQALLSEKDAYAQVDITENKIGRMGGIWDLYHEVIHKITYSELIQEFIFKVVHPEDRNHYFEVMSLDNLVTSFQSGVDRLTCEFRRIIEQNKMHWMGLIVYLFRDSVSGHLFGLFTLKNIDIQKKQSLELKNPYLMPSQVLSTPIDSFLGEHGDMAYFIDPYTFDLIRGNKAFYDRIGMLESECIGSKCYELMHRRNSPCPFCSKGNWNHDKYYIWRNYNYTLEQEFLIKQKLVNWQEREVLLILAIDISNDKNLLDSIGNEVAESRSILSGVQRMMEADDLEEAILSAIENIGYYFVADSVQIWKQEMPSEIYHQTYVWERNQKEDPFKTVIKQEYNKFIKNTNWNQEIFIQSQEEMLFWSYEMYQLMKKRGVENQKWFWLQEEGGFLVIENIRSNLRNKKFLSSFSYFIQAEIKKRRILETIVYTSMHDELTDLLNRTTYERYLGMFNTDMVYSIGVMLGDLNGLNKINRISGFHTGDYYITLFANMLKAEFEQFLVFRLNGDEFLVIAENVEQQAWKEKLDHIQEKIEQNGNFSVSIGHVWDNVEKNLIQLIDHSSQVMKLNKKRYYDTKNNSEDKERRKLLIDLITSIENEEYEIYLQPKILFSDGSLKGAEALIRYHHKDLGLIMPEKFIDVLERNNLIRYIDLYVFETVCRLLERWRKEGKFCPCISLNFSRLTLLEQNIVSTVNIIFSKYSVPKHFIEIEITESFSEVGKSLLYQNVRELRQNGFSISLDDFGVKYTNLTILSDLSVDVLKLDRSLSNSLETEQKNRVIVKNVIRMCKDLAIQVVAEGIETKTQQDILSELDCEIGQGYLYGKPMPVKAFEALYLKASIRVKDEA